MKYESPQLLDLLAAEHALGTLRGPARRRFERLCATSAAARSALDRWEDDWCALSGSLEPMQPSARVWANVSRQLFANLGSGSLQRPRWRAWQLAAAASVVALALIVGWLVREQQRAPQTLAVLGQDAAHPLWRIERSKELTALTIRVIGPVQRLPGKAYELWALPRGGRPPVSLGLLPAAGTFERSLNAAQRAALRGADKVAVSLEPETGSRTGSPTGPVVIVVSLPALG